ncbi:MAG: hypothetical protein IT185_06580 [Acidobacteria bacterium]|nr:hypothetical protein [Acidobacteriota bacterium]
MEDRSWRAWPCHADVTDVNRWSLILFVVVSAGLAYWVAPAGSDRRLVIPEHLELDALQQTLLIRDGITRVMTTPTRYFDTAILHPDHNQLRTTEPFLGYVILGLPLATVLRLDDVRVYEVLRWLMVFAGLLYVRVLLSALGTRPSLAVAGAMVCVLQPALVNGFERLQVLSIPLIAGVVYHAYVLWSGSPHQRRHQVGLCIMAVLYALCGAYNITMTVVAVLMALPLLVRLVIRRDTRARLGPLVAPLVVAAGLTLGVLGPWLTDRADLAAYAGAPFLAIKHWNAASAPGWLVWVSGAPWLYQLGIYLALLGFLVWQCRVVFPVCNEPWGRVAAPLMCGLGAVTMVLSFGPDVPSHTNPMATDMTARLLDVVPPLKAMREFERFWAFGWTLGVAGVLAWIAATRRVWIPMRFALPAITLAVLSIWPLATRTTALTRRVEAAPWFVALAEKAPGTGPIYVHPLMTWNTPSCVLMPDAARQLGRPLVNGCLGVPPPWFGPAAEVLRRFPDAEAIWLLRRWGVQAVVHLSNDLHVPETTALRLETATSEGRVYTVLDDGALPSHPSRGDTAETGRLARVSVGEVTTEAEGIRIAAPDDVWIWGVEVQFSTEGLVVAPMPTEITVTADRAGAPRLNRAAAGHWMQSLAAEALLARTAPVAVIMFDAPHRGPLRLLGAGLGTMVHRVVVLGEPSRN